MNLVEESLQELRAVILESFNRVSEDDLTRPQRYLLHSIIILAEIFEVTKVDKTQLPNPLQWQINLNKYAMIFILADSKFSISTNEFPNPDDPDMFFRINRSFDLTDPKSFGAISKCCTKIIKGMIPDRYEFQRN